MVQYLSVFDPNVVITQDNFAVTMVRDKGYPQLLAIMRV